jgi:hypothetical protein
MELRRQLLVFYGKLDGPFLHFLGTRNKKANRSRNSLKKTRRKAEMQK